jgi:exonuclease VII small subunit
MSHPSNPHIPAVAVHKPSGTHMHASSITSASTGPIRRSTSNVAAAAAAAVASSAVTRHPHHPPPSGLTRTSGNTSLTHSGGIVNATTATSPSNVSGVSIAPISINGLPIWADKDLVNQCSNHSCQKSFSILNVRNHCRWCGQVFCTSCCGFPIILPEPRQFIDGKAMGKIGPHTPITRAPLLPLPFMGKQKLCKTCCTELHQRELKLKQQQQQIASLTPVTPSALASPTSATSVAASASPISASSSSSLLRAGASSPSRLEGEPIVEPTQIEGQTSTPTTTIAPDASASTIGNMNTAPPTRSSSRVMTRNTSTASAPVRSTSRITAAAPARSGSNALTRSVSRPSTLISTTGGTSTNELIDVAALSSEFGGWLEQLEQSRLDEAGQLQALAAMHTLLRQGALLRLPNPYAAFVALLDFAALPSFVGAHAAVQVQTVELLQLLSLALLASSADVVTLYASAHASHEQALEELVHVIESQGPRLAGVRQNLLYLLSCTQCVLHLLLHSNSNRSAHLRHTKELVLTGLAFFGLGDVPLNAMLDELGRYVAGIANRYLAGQLYAPLLSMWCSLPEPGKSITVERLASVQGHFGHFIENASVGTQWELSVTYIALMHRYLQTLARPDCCIELGPRQRESLALNVLFGVPLTHPAAQAAAAAASGASASSAAAAVASSFSKTPRHLPGLLSGKNFRSLCLRSDWRVREKVVSVALDILEDAAAPDLPAQNADAAAAAAAAPPTRTSSRAKRITALTAASATSGPIAPVPTLYRYPASVIELLSSMLLERQLCERHPAVLETLGSRNRVRALKHALAAGWTRRKGEVESMLESQAHAVAQLQFTLEKALAQQPSTAQQIEVSQIRTQLEAAAGEFAHSRNALSSLQTDLSAVRADVSEVLARSEALQNSIDAQGAVLSKIARSTSAIHGEVKYLRAELEAVSHQVRRSADFTESLVAFQKQQKEQQINVSTSPPAISVTTNAAVSPSLISPSADFSLSATMPTPPPPPTLRHRSSGSDSPAAVSTVSRIPTFNSKVAAPSVLTSPRAVNSRPNNVVATPNATTPRASTATGLTRTAAVTTPSARPSTASNGLNRASASITPNTARVRTTPIATTTTTPIIAAPPTRSVSGVKRRNTELSSPSIPVNGTTSNVSAVEEQVNKRARAQNNAVTVAAPIQRASAFTGGIARSSATAGVRAHTASSSLKRTTANLKA